MKTPVAYIRKSRVIDERASVSWEVQEAKVRELAGQYGDNGTRLLILSDMNLSGRKGRAGRPGYRRLLEMIESGEATAIYSYNLARLSRSVQDLRHLMALADKHGVPVRLVADHVDTTTATGRMLLTILAAVDEMTADLASENARDAVAARRARGDRIGHPFYGEKPGEDADAVVAAYREKGSILGAARLLNVRGVPTRMGGPWSSISVRQLLVRRGEMPLRTRPGAKARAPFAFYGLLRCHCGHILTGTRYENGPQPLYTAYKCYMSRSVPNHGRGVVTEKLILAWAKEEAAHLAIPGEDGEPSPDPEARRAAILERFRRESRAYADGGLTDPEYGEAKKARDDALDALDAMPIFVRVPEAIEWDSWTPEKVNAVLRALWRPVQLGGDLRPPTMAEWIVPEWRA